MNRMLRAPSDKLHCKAQLVEAIPDFSIASTLSTKLSRIDFLQLLALRGVMSVESDDE